MRSYREEWINWGIVTGLQSILLMNHEHYSSREILLVARAYGVEEALLHRMSFVPATVEQIEESHP
jgi:hypothetical protein